MAQLEAGFLRQLAPLPLHSFQTHPKRPGHAHHNRPRWLVLAEQPLADAAAPAAAATTPPPSPPAASPLESIDPAKLKALRRLGLEMRDVIKLGRLGVGAGILNQIRNRWRTSEVAKLYCGGKAGVNMRAMAEALERETGGVVIHRAGGSVLLYRGENYDSGGGGGGGAVQG